MLCSLAAYRLWMIMNYVSKMIGAFKKNVQRITRRAASDDPLNSRFQRRAASRAVSMLLIFRRLERNNKQEIRPCAALTGKAYFAMHEGHEFLANGESQSGAIVATCA